MTWSATPVNGAQSVEDNKPNLNGAFTYADTNLKYDHYWNEGTTDGHHKAVQQKAQTDPTLSTDINLAWYPQVNATGGGTDSVPYALNNDGHKLYLGFRALVNFNGRSTNGECTYNFHHGVFKVERTGTGVYKITFGDTVGGGGSAIPLPTNKYIPQITVMGAGANDMYGAVQKNATYGNSVSNAFLIIQLTNNATTPADPNACFVSIVGG